MLRPDAPTESDITALLSRLAVAFGKQKEHEGNTADAVRLYRDVLKDLPLMAVRQGVDQIIKQDRYWPRPSRLRQAAQPFVPPRVDVVADDDTLRCPQGHALIVREYINRNGRTLGGRHWCLCEDRADAMYGTGWGHELVRQGLRWVPVATEEVA